MEIAQLDDLVREYQKGRAEYEARKKLANEAHEEYKKREFNLTRALEEVGKTKYEVDGVGKVSLITKMNVPTPKSPEDKKIFFDWLMARGEDFFLTYATVNSQSLNSLYRSEFDKANEKGELFSLPGIEDPTAELQVRFTKEKEKEK